MRGTVGGVDPHDGGLSVVEVLIAASIVAIATLIMLQQMTISYREHHLNEHKQFAYQKALTMLAEIQSAVDRGRIDDGDALELLDDGEWANPVLTTLTRDGALVAPDHPMSGNVLHEGAWLWSRRIRVANLESSDRMRYVVVEIERRASSGRLVNVATVGEVVNLPSPSAPAKKVYDVYLLAISSAPSTWMPMAELRTLAENARAELTSMRPSLDFRFHWITQAGYGRDESYIPFINVEKTATDKAPWAYWYPGTLDKDSAFRQLYVPELFAGRVRTEDGVQHDWSPDNPLPVAVADQFNSCMRTPRARVLHDLRVAEGLESEDEPPLQILLDDMYRRPERYRNAIFLNLHGGGLPFPPLRNYADAAKDPAGWPGVRVVTHPVMLRPARDPNGDGDHADSDDLVFQVYAYKTDPDAGADVLNAPITLQIMGVDLTAAAAAGRVQIRRLAGGIDLFTGRASGDRDWAYTTFDAAPQASDDHAPYEMVHEIGYVGGTTPYTWIRLHNTPLRTESVGGQGLAEDARLYGMEYVPTPLGRDLADDKSATKNTARWQIRISKDLFGGVVGGLADRDSEWTVVTRIGDDLSTGPIWPPVSGTPANLSVTYAWWAADPESVPLTERFQFQGDPRHNPYADLGADGSSFPHGYNWFFDDLRVKGPALQGQIGKLDARAKRLLKTTEDPEYRSDLNRARDLLDRAFESLKGDGDGVGAEDLVSQAREIIERIGGGWECLDRDRLRDGFGEAIVDVPRMMSVWRTALESCGAVFVNAGGPLAEYVLLGGEIAAPRDLLGTEPLPVRVNGDFFDVKADVALQGLSAAPGSSPAESKRLTSRRGRSLVVARHGPFWSKEWLGELVPDSAFGEYLGNGNLSTKQFHRELRSDVELTDLPAGTDFGFGCGSALGGAGGATLVQIDRSEGAFSQRLAPAESRLELTDGGRELFEAIGLPQVREVPGRWPFSLDWNPELSGLEHTAYGDIYPDHRVRVLEELSSGSGAAAGGGTAVIRLESPTSTERVCIFTIVGDTPQLATEHAELVRNSLVYALRSHHDAAAAAVDESFDPVPLVTVLSPDSAEKLEDPTMLTVRWRTDSRRFDGKPFFAADPRPDATTEQGVGYLVLISGDGGTTWSYAADGTAATPGERPEPLVFYLQHDSGAGNESFVMALPADRFPHGKYLLRVECHHATREVHYSYHEREFSIRREAR